MASLLRQSPALLPLTQIHATLTHAAPRLLAVREIVHLISSFADGSVRFTPTRAAASGSVRLFRRVAARLMDPSVDAIERDYSLCRALEAAIQADDLAIVQVIHDLHPERLDLSSFGLATEHGSLELVEWVVENRCDKMCSPAGVENVCMECAKETAISLAKKDTARVFSWLVDKRLIFLRAKYQSKPPTSIDLELFGGLWEIPSGAVRQSVDVVRWYDTHGLLLDEMIADLVSHSLEVPKPDSLNILRYLFERGPLPIDNHKLAESLLVAACYRGHEPVVEFVLESPAFASVRHHFVYKAREPGAAKVLQWDHDFEETQKRADASKWSSMMTRLGTLSPLETLKWLVAERKVTSVDVSQVGSSETEQIELIAWIHTTGIGEWSTWTMNLAAANGRLQVVQWLHENRTEGCTESAIDEAAGNGHFHVVAWLCKNRSEGCTPRAMTQAALCGHLGILCLLHESYGSLVSFSDLMANAALAGHLDVVQWCFNRGGCVQCVLVNLLSTTYTYGNVLYTVQWLDKYHESAADGCRGQCLTDRNPRTARNLAACAVAGRDLCMLNYLYEHHPKLFGWPKPEARSLAREMVSYGHIAVVQWLHAKIPHRFDWSSLGKLAEKKKRTKLLEWFRTLENMDRT